MISEALYINNYYVPLKTGLNPSITRSIADVREPNKRKSIYSKTATVPDSVEARQVFGQIFNVNLTSGIFNPTIKADLIYRIGGADIMNGYCQLKEVIITDDKEVTYDIVMYGEIANIFSKIKGKYLTDLDLSRWDHPFDKSVQEDSWATQVWDADVPGYIPFALGTGYVYPLIDYGLSQDATTFQTDHIPCAIYVKEYWDAIFTAAGFSYTSAFLNTDAFKGLIIPGSPESYVLNSTEIDERQFSANTPNFTSTASTTSGNLTKGSYGANDTLIFTNEISDTSGIYDHTTGKWTVVDAGWYTIDALIDVNATFTPVSQPAEITSEIRAKVRVLLNSGVLDETIAFITRDNQTPTSDWPYSTSATPVYPDGDYMVQSVYPVPVPFVPPAIIARSVNPPDRYNISTSAVYLTGGDVVEIAVSAGFFKGTSVSYFDNSSVPVDGNATLTISVGAFYNKVENTTLATGSTLEAAKIIPKGIKQDEFVMSLVKMYNLYLDPDPNDPNNLIVEPRDDYYGSTKVDIQSKIAIDKGIKKIPTGAMDANRYIYSYKEDKDYYNTKYNTEWQEVYGEREINVTNEFVQKDVKNDLIFSPTPLVALPDNDRVLPTIIEVDDLNQPKTVKHNIRILYYGGLKDCLHAWTFQKVIGNVVFTQSIETQYPYAGHWDDPFNPTLDINFGLVKEVYYDSNIQQITVTNNNLWNLYWSTLIGEITDPDSSIIECHVNVSPKDFKVWSFQDLYWFNNAYHRLNKIESYNPTDGSLTKCEFLKLKSVTAFTPSTYPVDDANDPITGPPFDNLDTNEDAPVNKSTGQMTSFRSNNNAVSKSSQQVQGNDNRVSKRSNNVYILGDGNEVWGEENIRLINSDNNTIGAGTSNITLINCDSLSLDSDDSDSTWINNKRQGLWKTETASFTAEDIYEGYFIDASSGAITVTIGDRTAADDIIFKRVDTTASNAVTIDPVSTITIDGALTRKLKPYESIRLKYNLDQPEYNIIN